MANTERQMPAHVEGTYKDAVDNVISEAAAVGGNQLCHPRVCGNLRNFIPVF